MVMEERDVIIGFQRMSGLAYCQVLPFLAYIRADTVVPRTCDEFQKACNRGGRILTQLFAPRDSEDLQASAAAGMKEFDVPVIVAEHDLPETASHASDPGALTPVEEVNRGGSGRGQIWEIDGKEVLAIRMAPETPTYVHGRRTRRCKPTTLISFEDTDDRALFLRHMRYLRGSATEGPNLLELQLRRVYADRVWDDVAQRCQRSPNGNAVLDTLNTLEPIVAWSSRAVLVSSEQGDDGDCEERSPKTVTPIVDQQNRRRFWLMLLMND
ncbi:unnamed protein product [Amoebophrya sp. A25]|nr:unnamed protein product [Amoebophrya sp. A25]|eukprot:GSA25T00002246001.1